MRALDAFLLTRIFTPLAWFIERRTGKNNFRQAEWCLHVSAVGMVLWGLTTSLLFMGRLWLWWYLPLMAVTAVGWVTVCFQKVKSVRRREELQARWPEVYGAIDTSGWRTPSLLMFFTTSSFILAVDLDHIHGWLTLGIPTFYYAIPNAIADFLVSIPRPPPQKKRQRDWFWFLRPLPVPA